MKSQNKFSKLITKLKRIHWRAQGFLLAIFGVVLLCRMPIEHLIAQNGALIFPEMHLSLLQEIVFCALVLGFLAFSVRKICKRLHLHETTAGILFTIIYIVIRFTGDIISFRSFKAVDSILYADVILLFGGVFAIGGAVWFYKDMVKSGNELNEASNTPAIDDKLDRLPFVNHLIGRIRASFSTLWSDHESNHNSIGVNAQWGEGKTFTLNLLKQELNQKRRSDDFWNKVEVVEFSPWKSLHEGMILRDFLGQLNQSLPLPEGDFGKRSKAYLRALGQLTDKNAGIELSSLISSLWERETTAKEEFENLNQLIRDSGKKLLVLVDDLDRLEKDELLETLRMVKILAAFDNVLFVVAYDKQQSVERLREVYGDHATEYLQKIFLEEVSLPPTTPPQLWDVFLHSCQKIDSTIEIGSLDIVKKLIFNINNDVDFESLRYQAVADRSTWQIKLAREAGMIAQNFMGLVSALGSEIQAQDLLLVSILQTRYPSVFEKIREGSLLTSGEDWIVFGQEGDISDFSIGFNNQKSEPKESTPLINQTLENCSSILKHLFPKKGRNQGQFFWIKESGEKKLEVDRINWKRNLNLLLQLSFHRSFDSTDLCKRLNENFPQLKALISTPESQRNITDIRLFLSSYRPEQPNETTIKNFLWLNLHIINLGIFQNIIPQEQLFGTSNKQLLKSVFGNHWEKLPELVHEYLKEFNKWDGIASTFWHYFRVTESEANLFDGDQVFWIHLNEAILEEYLNQSSIDGSIAIRIFHSCLDKLDNNNTWHASKESCNLLKKWAKKEKEKFLENIVKSINGQSLYFIPFLWNIFSKHEFEKFVKGWKSGKLLLEFIRECEQVNNNALVFPSPEQWKKYSPLTLDKSNHPKPK